MGPQKHGRCKQVVAIQSSGLTVHENMHFLQSAIYYIVLNAILKWPLFAKVFKS